jgi:hypothetical protein
MADGGSGGGGGDWGPPTSGKFILIDRRPVECPHLFCWARWIEERENCRVADSVIGRFRVSTVFLGVDHNWGGEGPPILFETMTFVAEPGQQPVGSGARRCSTWAEAEAVHAVSVAVAHQITYPERYDPLLGLSETHRFILAVGRDG